MNENEQKLYDALERITRLFGLKWPSVEVMVTMNNRPILPISDDDADHVRYARKLLKELAAECQVCSRPRNNHKMRHQFKGNQ